MRVLTSHIVVDRKVQISIDFSGRYRDSIVEISCNLYLSLEDSRDIPTVERPGNTKAYP
jgi:hypothetical protein